MATLTCTFKYLGASHAVPSGTVADIKASLATATNLAPAEMRIIVKGKVMSSDEARLPANTKGMLMRCAKQQPALARLSVREIVTGRLAPKVEVALSMPHDALVAELTSALKLPPCDEHTEVRIFLPPVGVLMRRDLSLADYPTLPVERTINVFAVPCPKAPQPEQQAQLIEEAEELRRMMSTPSDRPPTADEAVVILNELAAHASASLPLRDAQQILDLLETLVPPKATASSDVMRDAEPSPEGAPAEGSAPAAPLLLPPSIVEAAEAESRGAPSTPCGGPMGSQTRSQEGSSGQTGCSGARPSSSLVPTRIRTGLMPAHDEPAPRSVEAHQRPMALLAAEAEAYDQACAPPTAEEWEAYTLHEEDRLEMRCAELIASLTPTLPSPKPAKHGGSRGLLGTGRVGASRRSRASGRHRHSSSARKALFTDTESLSASSSSAASCALSDDDAAFGSEEESLDECCEFDGSTCGTCEAVDGPPELPKGGKGGKVKGSACKSCGVRLPLTACTAACRCGHTFCAAHMHDHACHFDYKTPCRDQLREDNPKMEGPKLERL